MILALSFILSRFPVVWLKTDRQEIAFREGNQPQTVTEQESDGVLTANEREKNVLNGDSEFFFDDAAEFLKCDRLF